MPEAKPAQILRIQVSEADRCGGKPLYEVIVAKCRELKIAGATVFQGLEGFGDNAELHRARLVRSDRPILITVVDTAENIRRLIPAIADLMDTGLMATSAVEMIRIQKRAAREGTGA